MGLLTFIKDAGEKLFGDKDSGQKPAAAPTGGTAKPDLSEMNEKAGQAILAYIRTQNLDAKGLAVSFDGATTTATVRGEAADQATREKIVLCCGNVQGVSHVTDEMTVTQSAPEARFYTVVRGDTLSKISKEMYGEANAYMKIFEANKPMLKHPDKIYPGQVLRVPA